MGCPTPDHVDIIGLVSGAMSKHTAVLLGIVSASERRTTHLRGSHTNNTRTNFFLLHGPVQYFSPLSLSVERRAGFSTLTDLAPNTALASTRCDPGPRWAVGVDWSADDSGGQGGGTCCAVRQAHAPCTLRIRSGYAPVWDWAVGLGGSWACKVGALTQALTWR